jgi:cell volume regulation protein A
VLFLTLGLLVFPSHVIPYIGIGLAISAFLILVARPVSVFLSLSFFRIQNRSRLFISWVGLRGAVPIVFATYPLLAGADKASMIFNIVFFVSLTSVLIQGTTLSVVAKWLHLALPVKARQRTAIDIERDDSIKSLLTEIIVPADSKAIGLKIVDVGIPKTAMISFIQRNGMYITPSGSTQLESNDRLFVISESEEDISKISECLKSREAAIP